VYLGGRERGKIRCAGLEREGVDDVSYEEEDTCMSYEEEDACMSYEEEEETWQVSWKECGVDDVDMFSMNL
jgi:hypothetical protein